MREILFRGKRVDNGKWVEGGYVKHDTVKVCLTSDDPKTEHMIVCDGFCDWGFEPPLQGAEVVPETIGQYTGLQDKNGKRIFDGDIIQHDDMRGCICYGAYSSAWECEKTHLGFYVDWIGETLVREDIIFWTSEREIEVIGNAYDNFELIEEGAKE